jgi:hypothetical protein
MFVSLKYVTLCSLLFVLVAQKTSHIKNMLRYTAYYSN